MKNQKKLKRRAAKLMGLAMCLMFSMEAMAASYQEVTLDGSVVKAWSSVTETLAIGSTASTEYTPSVEATVSGTYIYVHPVNGESGSVSKSAMGMSSATISFTPPQYYRSLSLQCHHTASKGVQDWSCDTLATYYP